MEKFCTKMKWVITWGEVAEANKGSNPPQAIIKLSDNCDIKWTALTTKMALSPLLTNSSTDLVLWLEIKETQVNNGFLTPKNIKGFLLSPGVQVSFNGSEQIG